MADPLQAIEEDQGLEAAQQFGRSATRFLEESASARPRVTTPLSAAELAARFTEPLPRRGRPLAEVLARVERDILSHSIRLSHPMYLGHQVSAPLPAAVNAELLTSALNNSIAVSEMSPAGTAVERQVLRWMLDLVGWGAEAGGVFTSGGTEATFTALLAARARLLPDAWEQGVGPNPPVIVCGEHAHYAVSRAAGELGLGVRNLVLVPSRDWRMDPVELERGLARLASEGRRVMAVVATAGSTPTGSFDDLSAIADLCDARDIWLHVDGAHGASALLSERHRHRLHGIERARSLAWDPHKMMLLPLSAGMLLVRNEADLDAAFAQRAPYLFHGTGGQRVADQGVRSFQCSRRFDALKVWVALQRYGAEGIGGLYDRLAALAAELHRLVGQRGDFEPLHQPECNILCFRYTGTGAAGGAGTPARDPQLALRERYNASGEGWITTTVLGGRQVLRVTVMNPRTTSAHLVALLDGLARAAAAG